MCGIAGFQGTGSLDDARRMIARIAYRGPDAQGAVMNGNTALAHARLSVIDPGQRSDQPMSDEHDELGIVFNGEIYNHLPLREELRRKGHSFSTASDTEVLLHLYREHGAAMLPKLNGMFAFAIHDRRSGELFLARDRMGKKPLYYAESPGTFVFGSELKAVLAHPAVADAVDPLALGQYLSFEYVPAPRTIIQGVRKLEPGHCLRVKEGRILSDTAWWKIDLTQRPIAEAEAMARLDEALGDATERRLMSDVPLGVFLSGGIDSSAVAWYAQQRSSQRIKTFSIGFEEASYDESAQARLVAKHIGSDHHERTLTRQACVDLIPGLYAMLDEPFADPSIIPTHLLSLFAREQVTVALGGDGSDELLAGYPTFTADRYRAFFAALPSPVIHALRSMAALLPSSDKDIAFDFRVKQFLRGFGENARHTHTRWLGGFLPEEKSALLHPELAHALRGTHGLEPIDDVYRGSTLAPGSLNGTILAYLRTYLPDDILFKVDRASMYASLEVRAPFLDVEVVELINSLPQDLKRRGANGKYLLKRLMRGKLPDAIIDRPKKGFGIPLSAWLREDLRPLCEDLLDAPLLRQQGYFNAPYIERLKREHMTGRANHRKLLWTLMAFQLWLRQRQH